MPTILSAKEIVEKSLQKIGRFPTTQAAANPVDLKRGLETLEIILQDYFGQGSLASAKGTVQIPLLSSTPIYQLKYYENQLARSGVQFVYSAELLEVASGSRTPVDVINEEKFFLLNPNTTGLPCAVYVNKGPDVSNTLVQIHPMLGSQVADGTYTLLMQVQTFATAITDNSGAQKLNIRPTLYLWAITKLAYQLGTGTIRRLPKQETDQFKIDYEEIESKISFDNVENDNQPYTEPWGQ